ncbi:MAG: transporter substrate-binding domain-containing protein [Pedobacter sp.]|nr:transporter substrate-binding domain-containing protein [Pedobacter sp.]
MRALLSLLLLLPSFVLAQTLTLAVDPWPPFTEKNGKGVATQVVRAALKRSGVTLKTVDVSWDKAWEGSVAGRYDGVLAIWFDADRAQALQFSEPYMLNRLVMVVRKKDATVIKGLPDLAGRRVGVVKGYAYHPEFDAAANFPRVESASLSVSMGKLAAAEVEVVVDSEVAIEHWLRRNPKSAKQLAILPDALGERALYLALNRDVPNAEKILGDFNAAIKAMKADGSLRKLLHAGGK